MEFHPFKVYESFFFTPQLQYSDKNFKITTASEVHHVSHVLKLPIGATLQIFNGSGVQANGTITNITAHSINIKILSMDKTQKISKTRFILACAIPKKGKFETIIEKTTELGVDEIIPLQTHRTQILLTGERLEKKIQRYKTVAINASKQSRRATVPVIHSVHTFTNAIEQQLAAKNKLFIPSLENKTLPILNAFKETNLKQTLTFFIGPEGDFTEKEYALAQKVGCIPVNLGETILKVETAAISTIACAQMYFRKKAPII